MSETVRELVERIHREAVESYPQQRAQERALVETVFRETVERHREELRQGHLLVEAAHMEAAERMRGQLLPRHESATIHHTQFPSASSDSPLRQEWDTYHSEVARLLAEGRAGRHVLIKGDQIISLWDNHAEALAAGYEQFLGRPPLVHQIAEHEPLLCCTSVQPCRNTRIR